MHHDPPDMPVECLVPDDAAVRDDEPVAALPDPDLHPLGPQTDHAPVYRWHEKVLQLLQSGGVRGRWQLKSPQHALALEALVAQYPDARFIVTHRDPGDVRRVDGEHGPGVRRHVRAAAAGRGVRPAMGRHAWRRWARGFSISDASTATTVSSTCPTAI